ncbi:ComF family protein [Pseudomonas sp. 10B1]|uniref:ComF family protein n=1 Tax=unclassified Pseudomonas TaxID=196821 RepID=UPI002AB533E9|nr:MULTISPECIES: ComF family protein [unclassified Pseudomonas]MDY7562231.1 ComF family protein [Pseudomonas sp. AB6]MEA9978997.1 ComF family protein [Pseudomonas sp. RTS4]MEA9996164.1 ComF family protein [Pseudomonas sp. AA4]MEB0087522.1 ComF family protein [Pseudomonas sp. RTI1]MEB0127612.1 ComF family protein [Pseudomonas sp. CCC1.2]
MRCQPQSTHQVYIWLKNKQTCLLCDETTDALFPICTGCETDLPWLGDSCERCALPMPMAGLTCGQCRRQPPAFSDVVVPWRYDFPVDSLVTRFKHQGKWPMGRLLAQLLGQALQHRFAEGLARPDCLLPVPLANKRLRQRGYNQAEMLARWLGTQLDVITDEHLLLRVLDTPAQQGLDAKARQSNLRKAFAIRPGAQIKGKHFAVVDDVLTTGATVNALSRLLLDGGARRVDIYCLARTPKPQD